MVYLNITCQIHDFLNPGTYQTVAVSFFKKCIIFGSVTMKRREWQSDHTAMTKQIAEKSGKSRRLSAMLEKMN